MKKKSSFILYIGNNLTQRTKYNSTLTVLTTLLKKENFTVYISSDKRNKIVRLIAMCFSVFKFRNKVDYILIDTFSTTNFYYAFLTSQIARVFKKKYIPILHGGNLPSRIKRNSYLSQLIFSNSYKNVAPSSYLKDAFEKEGYLVNYIPNIIEVGNYHFKLRENLKPKLLWVRAFKEIYNPTLAIEVLNLLKKEYPSSELCMVGPFVDNSYNDCLTLVKKYHLEDSVEFTDVLLKEKWHKKSKEFDIFINTTNFDNTPVSVMEAMALGLIVVSTNVGGMPSLIKNNVDGVLVERDNPIQMVNAITKLIKGNNKDLMLNARDKVERFGWSKVKYQWYSILK